MAAKSQWKRILVCVVPLFATLCISFSNSLYIPAVPYIMAEFHVSSYTALLPVTVFNAGLAIGPITAGALCESYGRRPVYILCMTGSVVFTAMIASASNFPTLLIGRFLASVCAAPVITVAIGTVTDIWGPESEMEDTGRILASILMATTVWGTEIGSPIAVLILTFLPNWRWIFRILVILLSVASSVCLCSETSIMPMPRSSSRRPTGGLAFFQQVLRMLRDEPMLLPSSLVSCLALSVVLFFYIAFPLIYAEEYHFSLPQASVAYLSMFFGSLFGFCLLLCLDRGYYQPAKAKAAALGCVLEPEERLYPVIVGGILLPIGLLCFAWTTYSRIHWMIPLLCRLPIGIAYFLITAGWPLYRNEIYSVEHGRAAAAADHLLRFTTSSCVPLLAAPLLDRVGQHWAVSIAGFVALVLVPVPLVVYIYGRVLRRRSRYIST
ncbi:hypothetical protein ASPZODRAFT_147637 [Penicilliopsis zonata CBS 506.65]|uniref:Major facilitator superfamily (MFS) profile domain-containing protein n=1 Tax=Penicilliopsis zonata CBS 506.65 TaxID=1073090 RepID=A0A1L9S531_9EURO|nr:hypothetical protein ASPZODRAFT_147637 [Penicilliopsis zonata CBS 506.65]OJJ42262.1 hypothetical protein ASPZODRAFT_147637 [Penicilliopsis zonata CBS 506.65]